MPDYNPRYQRHRPFLVVDTIYRPASGVHTERRGWRAAANAVDATEQPTIVYRVSDKIAARADIIFDLVEDRVVKCRRADLPDAKQYCQSRFGMVIANAMTGWNRRTFAARTAGARHAAR